MIAKFNYRKAICQICHKVFTWSGAGIDAEDFWDEFKAQEKAQRVRCDECKDVPIPHGEGI